VRRAAHRSPRGHTSKRRRDQFSSRRGALRQTHAGLTALRAVGRTRGPNHWTQPFREFAWLPLRNCKEGSGRATVPICRCQILWTSCLTSACSAKTALPLRSENQRRFLSHAGVDCAAIPVVLRSVAQNCATPWINRFPRRASKRRCDQFSPRRGLLAVRRELDPR